MAKQTSNQRLFDLMFRHQVYLEMLKIGLSARYVHLLRGLYDEFSKYLMQNRFATMDQFNKFELEAFVRKFENAQRTAYNDYTQELLKLLQQFLAADREVNAAIMSDVTGETPQTATLAALWAAILSDPIPANGFLTKDYINGFAVSSIAAVSALLRQGYANGWTMVEQLRVIVGNPENNFTDGFFAKLSARDRSMVNTIVQHISASVSAAVASSITNRYMWSSVLDDRTTEICRSRDGNIYTYGDGPLPPAHYNCRSKAVPLVGTDSVEEPSSYTSWLRNQPEAFKNDATDVTKPLTIEQFQSKIPNILGE